MQLTRYPEAFDALTNLNRAGIDGSLLNNLGIVQLRRPCAGRDGPPGRCTYFTDAVAVEGADSDLLFDLGYAYWLDRDLPNAIQSLREAVRRRPTDDAAHYVLGVALQMSGNAGKARVNASWPGVSRRNTRSGKRHSRRRTRCRKGSSVCGPSCQRRRFAASKPISSRRDNATSRSSPRFTSMRAAAHTSSSETMKRWRRFAGRSISPRTTPRRTSCSARVSAWRASPGGRRRVHDLDLEPRLGRRATGPCRGIHPDAERSRGTQRASDRAESRAVQSGRPQTAHPASSE